MKNDITIMCIFIPFMQQQIRLSDYDVFATAFVAHAIHGQYNNYGPDMMFDLLGIGKTAFHQFLLPSSIIIIR